MSSQKGSAGALGGAKQQASPKNYVRLLNPAEAKFWEVEVKDEFKMVNYGAIGQAGRVNTVEHGSKAEALDSARKAIKDKRSKGFTQLDSTKDQAGSLWDAVTAHVRVSQATREERRQSKSVPRETLLTATGAEVVQNPQSVNQDGEIFYNQYGYAVRVTKSQQQPMQQQPITPPVEMRPIDNVRAEITVPMKRVGSEARRQSASATSSVTPSDGSAVDQHGASTASSIAHAMAASAAAAAATTAGATPSLNPRDGISAAKTSQQHIQPITITSAPSFESHGRSDAHEPPPTRHFGSTYVYFSTNDSFPDLESSQNYFTQDPAGQHQPTLVHPQQYYNQHLRILDSALHYPILPASSPSTAACIVPLAGSTTVVPPAHEIMDAARHLAQGGYFGPSFTQTQSLPQIPPSAMEAPPIQWSSANAETDAWRQSSREGTVTLPVHIPSVASNYHAPEALPSAQHPLLTMFVSQLDVATQPRQENVRTHFEDTTSVDPKPILEAVDTRVDLQAPVFAPQDAAGQGALAGVQSSLKATPSILPPLPIPDVAVERCVSDGKQELSALVGGGQSRLILLPLPVLGSDVDKFLMKTIQESDPDALFPTSSHISYTDDAHAVSSKKRAPLIKMVNKLVASELRRRREQMEQPGTISTDATSANDTLQNRESRSSDAIPSSGLTIYRGNSLIAFSLAPGAASGGNKPPFLESVYRGNATTGLAGIDIFKAPLETKDTDSSAKVQDDKVSTANESGNASAPNLVPAPNSPPLLLTLPSTIAFPMELPDFHPAASVGPNISPSAMAPALTRLQSPGSPSRAQWSRTRSRNGFSVAVTGTTTQMSALLKDLIQAQSQTKLAPSAAHDSSTLPDDINYLTRTSTVSDVTTGTDATASTSFSVHVVMTRAIDAHKEQWEAQLSGNTVRFRLVVAYPRRDDAEASSEDERFDEELEVRVHMDQRTFSSAAAAQTLFENEIQAATAKGFVSVTQAEIDAFVQSYLAKLRALRFVDQNLKSSTIEPVNDTDEDTLRAPAPAWLTDIASLQAMTDRLARRASEGEAGLGRRRERKLSIAEYLEDETTAVPSSSAVGHENNTAQSNVDIGYESPKRVKLE